MTPDAACAGSKRRAVAVGGIGVPDCGGAARTGVQHMVPQPAAQPQPVSAPDAGISCGAVAQMTPGDAAAIAISGKNACNSRA